MPLPLVAFFAPFLLGVALFVPLCSGFFAAVYGVYWLQGKPLGAAQQWLLDPFLMLTTYQKLWHFWEKHAQQVDFFTYTLPLFGLPVVGAGLAFFLIRWVVRLLRDMTHHGG